MTRQEWRAKLNSDVLKRGLDVAELAEATGEMFEEVFFELTRQDCYLKRLTAKDMLAVALYDVRLLMPAVERLLDLSAIGRELDAEVEKALDYVRAAWMNR